MVVTNQTYKFIADHQVIDPNGIFNESQLRSAPYFDVDIDGITIK